MDEDDDAFENPARSSPRLSSKNAGKKKIAEERTSDSGTDSRHRKKRKIQTKLNQKVGKGKQNVGFKCCPHLLHDLIKNLDKDQKFWVDELGFGILISMPKCRLPKGLIVWLINHVDWGKKALVISGQTIKIKPVMKNLLGIPDGPLHVPLPRSKRGKSLTVSPTVKEKELKDGRAGKGLSYKSTYEALIANHDPIKFKRAFMLYVLCVYFAPSSGHVINRSYSPVVSNVNLIKEMNWCDHVADFLFEGIREYRESKALNVNVHGCVHVLLLVYIDLVRSALLEIPKGTPRVNHVTSEMIELLEYHDLKFTTNDGPEYGKLEIDAPNFVDEKSFTGCSPSREAMHIDKLMFEEMTKIESDYAEARKHIYEEYFRQLSKEISKIDSIRSDAISMLLNKYSVPSNHFKTPPDSSSNIESDNRTHTTKIQHQTAALLTQPSLFITPTKVSPIMNCSSDRNSEKDSLKQSPFELSLRALHGNRNLHCKTPVSRSPDMSTPSQIIDEEAEHSSISVDFASKSMDLQHTCRVLSTILVNKAGSNKIIKSAQSQKSPRLEQKGSISIHDFAIHDSSDDVDPMGFDIMKEVAAIAKESSEQAVLDAAPENLAYDDLSTECTLNQETPCSFPVQCTQPEQSTLEDISNPSYNSKGSQHGPNTRPPTSLYFTVDDTDKDEPTDCNLHLFPGPTIDDMSGFKDTLESAAADIVESEQIVSHVTSVTFMPSAPNSIDATPPQLSIHVPATACQVRPAIDQELNKTIYIPRSPEQSYHHDMLDVHMIGSPIPGGELFADAGRVNSTVRSRAKRFGKSEGRIDGIAELIKTSSKMKPHANQTYSQHVENSAFNGTTRKTQSDPLRNSGGKTKIRIRGVYISEEEFVHNLKQNGEVDHNFMWVCCVAIMLDWASSTKTILNQSIIAELTNPQFSCDHKKIATKLKMLDLGKIDQVYLPVCNKKHWILIVISIFGELFEIYDSLRDYKKGEDPDKELWTRIGTNLQIAYSYATSKYVPIHDMFKKQYPQIQTHDTLHDSGFDVIRLLVCHNGKDLICYGKINMIGYRKEVAHILLYHRYNDLNPKRNTTYEEADT